MLRYPPPSNNLCKKHNTKCRLLCNTQHSSDTFWFLLQVCRYLIEAAKSGDVNTAKKWENCSHDSCTADDEDRNTPLIYAADKGHVRMVRVLLEGGANVQRANANKWTALHSAAWNGHLDVCRLLLDWGAKVDPQDEWEYTPLMHAAGRGELSVVKLLVERGADVRLGNVDGMTASDQARRSERTRHVAEWLDTLSRG
jgi:ankyrin repeat protein